MLHDPSHIPVVPSEEEIVISGQERDILRQLGEEIYKISQDKINGERKKLWTKLNDKQAERPMVWINEVPWHEMNVNDELTLRTQHPWARALEQKLKRTIYQWNHFPGDMVVNDYLDCEKVFYSTDFGIVEDVDVVKTDAENEIYSRHFKIQIEEPEDIEKIVLPRITYMEKATNCALEAMLDIFKDVIDVKLVGQTHIWFTPWDYLIRWWGVEEALMDLYARPEMVHAAYARMVDCWMTELDQFESLGLLSLDNNNTRIGSGGYGYVSDLPGKEFDPEHVLPANMWGCSNAQIFAGVSPEMHWEFAIEHDLKWLNRFGLTYYGCCEPLDTKADILKRIPNLRKVSVSAWVDVNRAVDQLGQYVLSRKPNPAVFVGQSFGAELARDELKLFNEAAKGCSVEYIMKDISTVNYKPERLWQWEKIAMEVVGG